jgi:hypothetical protein
VSPKKPGSAKLLQVSQLGTRFNAILSQLLTNKECQTLHRGMYTPALQYVLQNLCMPEEKICNSLKMTKANFSNGFNYSRNTKNEIVYGCKSLGGIGYHDQKFFVMNLHFHFWKTKTCTIFSTRLHAEI